MFQGDEASCGQVTSKEQKGFILYLRFSVYFIVLIFLKDWSVGSGDISLIHPVKRSPSTFF